MGVFKFKNFQWRKVVYCVSNLYTALMFTTNKRVKITEKNAILMKNICMGIISYKKLMVMH